MWDQRCVSCHGGKNPDGGLDLTGELTERFNRSYEALMPERRRAPRTDRGLLGPIIGENHPKTGNVEYLPPKSLGSHASVLVAMLANGKVVLMNPRDAERVAKLAKAHREVSLTPEELVRVTTWVDSNGQYYGSYFGKRNLRYKADPGFRPIATFEDAVRQR